MRGLPQALRHRDYALLWSGQTISVVGDGIYTVAIALEALRISNHASTLAYVEAARVAPNALFLIFAGALVDRLPRRFVVLGANALRAGVIAALAALVLAHALNLTDLVLLSAVVGVGDAFFYPAYRAIMPELLAVLDLPVAPRPGVRGGTRQLHRGPRDSAGRLRGLRSVMLCDLRARAP